MADRILVRMLQAVGADAQNGPYKVGDEIELVDRELDPDYVRPGGPTTLIESYVAAGYVEVLS